MVIDLANLIGLAKNNVDGIEGGADVLRDAHFVKLGITRGELGMGWRD
jgi:hypothetical protein